MITREKKDGYIEVTITCDGPRHIYSSEKVVIKTNLLNHQTDFDFRRVARQRKGWSYLSIEGQKYDLCKWCWGGGMFSHNWSVKFARKSS